MDRSQIKGFVAKRVAKELKDGDVVNLGIGLPTLVANYLPKDIDITLQSESEFIGIGPTPEKGKENKYIVNVGGSPMTINDGLILTEINKEFTVEEIKNATEAQLIISENLKIM